MKKTTIAGSFLTVGLLGGGVLWGVQNDRIQAEVPGLDAKVTMEEAKAIAEKETQSVVEGIELEKKLTGPVYEVDTQGYDVKVDGESGKVLKKQEDTDDDRDDDYDDGHNASVTVTEEEARAAAQKQVKGTIEKVELDDGHYEIEIKDGQKETEVHVDGSTGEVVIEEEDLDD
ncbi:PepSY domain-containing protein [Domibacillus robiginosus]|uniref:PepSY domain-containing protein n=1 Tax=Domibacillus robiginosus TaxID=1071054 RepID=UPI00067C8C92|nr:PepSY domain-containing protein [Domibacillus robiginosus]